MSWRTGKRTDALRTKTTRKTTRRNSFAATDNNERTSKRVDAAVDSPSRLAACRPPLPHYATSQRPGGRTAVPPASDKPHYIRQQLSGVARQHAQLYELRLGGERKQVAAVKRSKVAPVLAPPRRASEPGAHLGETE